MSYECMLADARDLVAEIPDSSEPHRRSSQLVDELALRGVEVPAYYANTGIRHPDSIGAEFLVACNNPFSEQNRVHLPKDTLATVSYNLDRPVLYFGDYSPEHTYGIGMLTVHELTHVDQFLRMSEAEHEASCSEFSSTSVDQRVGKAEREAYGLNLRILQAIDGEAVNDYFGSWPNDISILERNGMQFGAIRFRERRFRFVPLPKSVFFPEAPTRLEHAWNMVATAKGFLQSFPKPPKGSFMRELWGEGGISKQILHRIGHMAVLEATFADKLSSEEIDEVAGAEFGAIL